MFFQLPQAILLTTSLHHRLTTWLTHSPRAAGMHRYTPAQLTDTLTSTTVVSCIVSEAVKCVGATLAFSEGNKCTMDVLVSPYSRKSTLYYSLQCSVPCSLDLRQWRSVQLSIPYVGQDMYVACNCKAQCLTLWKVRIKSVPNPWCQCKATPWLAFWCIYKFFH